MPRFICPNCGDRSLSTERTAGFQNRARACKKCGFGFLFELLDDYYPAPNAAFFIIDQQGRLIGTGRGARELTGLGDLDVIGRPVMDVLGLEFGGGDDHIGIALEWGVRVLDKPVTVHAEGDRPETAKADIFPAYDDDGGLLLVLTPRMTSRNRNLGILGIVVALLIALGGRDRHEAHQAGPRPARRHRARLPGPPDSPGADRHAAGGGRRDRHDPQAHELARRHRDRDPALRARPDLRRAARRAERPARRSPRSAPPRSSSSTTGSRTCSAVAPTRRTRARRRSTRPPRRPRSRSRRPRPPTCHRAPTRRRPRPMPATTRRAPRASTCSGPTRSRSVPTAQPLRTGDYDPGGTCEEVLSDFDSEPGEPARVRQGDGVSGGAEGARLRWPAGRLSGDRGAQGHRGGRGRARREPAAADPALLRDRGRHGAKRHRHQEPEGGHRPEQPARGDDGVHRQGPRGVRPGDQADRRARLQDHPPVGHPARADLPALRDHARQLDRLAGDDRLRLEPRGHRRAHGRPDREHRELPGDQRPGGEPSDRRPADRRSS